MEIILRSVYRFLGISSVWPTVNRASPSEFSLWTQKLDRFCPCSRWYHLVLDHQSTDRQMCSWSIQPTGAPSTLLKSGTKNIWQAFSTEHRPLHYFSPSHTQCQGQLFGFFSPTSIVVHSNLMLQEISQAIVICVYDKFFSDEILLKLCKCMHDAKHLFFIDGVQ